MATIRNKLNQRLIINLAGGKNIDLLAKGTITVTEKELASPHLQTLIANNDVVIIPGTPSTKSEKTETKAVAKEDTQSTDVPAKKTSSTK